MCGIVGYVGVREAAPILLSGLKKLEYRGYDSAGVAVHTGENGRIALARAQGSVENLVRMTEEGRALQGTCGVGHTRWATHGEPSVRNAHPQASAQGRVVLVHNGVVENHAALRTQLEKEGCAFGSDTDTEAAAALLDTLYEQAQEETPQARAVGAIRRMMLRLEGSYALGILFADQPDALYAARRESPLIIGVCGDGHVIASDVPAVLGMTRQVIALGEMETACITREAVHIYKLSGEQFERQPEEIEWNADEAEKGGYPHFMLKEIMEQPRAVRDTLAAWIQPGEGGYAVSLPNERSMRDVLQTADRVLLTGCGSAYHAGLVGAQVIERLAHVEAFAHLASEVSANEPIIAQRTLAIVISQSGETADTLAALRRYRERGVYTLAIVNVVGSAIAREADAVLYTRCGMEIAVATTKAYSAQLAALYVLAVRMTALRGRINLAQEQELLGELLALPEKMEEALRVQREIQRIADEMPGVKDVFFVGRGLDHAVCMEGSLKLKEVAYIHAEAYPAGELKHGAISLIEEGVWAVGVMGLCSAADRTRVNLSQARTRGARLMVVAPEGTELDEAQETVHVPRTNALFMPSLEIVPLQLLAYYAGCARGLDVDKPRNLAKSVTVE